MPAEFKLTNNEFYLDGIYDAINLGLEVSAQAIVDRARGYVPVKTGRLRDSISYEIISETESEGGDSRVEVGSFDVPCASAVEQRTPYLAPALEEVATEIAENIREELR